MYIKIYINNKPLFLCNSLDNELNLLVHYPDSVFIDELDTHTIKSMLKELSLPQIKTGIFLHKDLEQLTKVFLKKFEIIPAGGGLVVNEHKEILMIFRRGFWDLPKGKLDKGETIEECAVREVKEETGLQNINLKKYLTTTYHSYNQGTHHYLKESHWYLMKAKSGEPLIPQREEDIIEIEWIGLHKLEDYIPHAYPSIADVLALHMKNSSK
jgi:8-oxo-dGTP pyrophosphatase MutT (NUDIX family)